MSLHSLILATRISLSGLKQVLAYYIEKGEAEKVYTTAGVFWKWKKEKNNHGKA